MIKRTLKAKPSFKYSFLLASMMFAFPVTGMAATDPEPPTPDYTKPVCEGIDEEDGEACIERLNTFCAIPENVPYKDCMEWKLVQEEVKIGGNDDPNVMEPPAGGIGGVIGAAGSVAQVLMFSPSSFAAQQAIGLIQQIFTCKSAMSEEEKALPNRLSANLCIYVGEYCSKQVKILGVKLCRTKKKTYCCYNSTLARIINTEGNQQLGRGMGDAKNTTCTGFTIDEFGKLDLSKMDLTEFVEEVTAKAQASGAKTQDYWEKRNGSRLETTWQNVDTEDMKYKILTSDNPYEALNQPTSGKGSAQQEGRVVQAETQANTPTAKETGVNPINQNELNEAKNKFKSGATN